MKKFNCLLYFLCALLQLNAQNLPVKTVTVFKNGQSVISKNGKVAVVDGKYVLRSLPDALFGTFWTFGDLHSVFSVQDSMETPVLATTEAEILQQNAGKQVRIWLYTGATTGPELLEGVFEKNTQESPSNASKYLAFQSNNGKWQFIEASKIQRFEFAEKPERYRNAKKVAQRMEVNFKTNKKEQELGIVYLTNNLGWTPVYKLDLSNKDKGKLALRAEVVNDAEDLGDADLRLVVGSPNFRFATKPSDMVNFGNILMGAYTTGQDLNPYRGNALFANQMSNAGYYNEAQATPAASEGLEGSQAEDFFFYSVRPGRFPKNSRYQCPVLEADIAPVHFYECFLPNSNVETYQAYKTQGQKAEEKLAVSHFIEFANTTASPWTTGMANISSQSSEGMQPISQDLLPYTPPGGQCKVKIAQSPEIKVTHTEGDIGREEGAKKFFSQTFDRVKIEGQICAINYKKEAITLKIRRNIEGAPLATDPKWTTIQEAATLRVNPSFVAEWIIELKPGEERKWKYSYEVFVNY